MSTDVTNGPETLLLLINPIMAERHLDKEAESLRQVAEIARRQDIPFVYALTNILAHDDTLHIVGFKKHAALDSIVPAVKPKAGDRWFFDSTIDFLNSRQLQAILQDFTGEVLVAGTILSRTPVELRTQYPHVRFTYITDLVRLSGAPATTGAQETKCEVGDRLRFISAYDFTRSLPRGTTGFLNKLPLGKLVP